MIRSMAKEFYLGLMVACTPEPSMPIDDMDLALSKVPIAVNFKCGLDWNNHERLIHLFRVSIDTMNDSVPEFFATKVQVQPMLVYGCVKI